MALKKQKKITIFNINIYGNVDVLKTNKSNFELQIS